MAVYHARSVQVNVESNCRLVQSPSGFTCNLFCTRSGASAHSGEKEDCKRCERVSQERRNDVLSISAHPRPALPVSLCGHRVLAPVSAPPQVMPSGDAYGVL